jgi:archaellin
METNSGTMNNEGNLGLLPAILLISLMLIGATAASVILKGSDETSSEQDLNKIVDDITKEICSYIQIKDTIGKYDQINGQQKIQKIGILIKPLISINIDVSTLTIKITNGEQLRMLPYSGQAAFISSQSFFGHPLWDDMTSDSFSFLVVLDTDRSLVEDHTLDDCTDMAYIAIKLSEDFTMKKGDSLTITLFPSTGLTRTITVTAPLPTQKVFTFD